jgi:hypothetical protein
MEIGNGSSIHIAMGQRVYIQCAVTKLHLYKGENRKHYLYMGKLLFRACHCIAPAAVLFERDAHLAIYMAVFTIIWWRPKILGP